MANRVLIVVTVVQTFLQSLPPFFLLLFVLNDFREGGYELEVGIVFVLYVILVVASIVATVLISRALFARMIKSEIFTSVIAMILTIVVSVLMTSLFVFGAMEASLFVSHAMNLRGRPN